jgi:hypothetical protein
MPLLPLQPVLQKSYYPLLPLPQGQASHALLPCVQARLVVPLLLHRPAEAVLGGIQDALLSVLLLLLLHLAVVLHL